MSNFSIARRSLLLSETDWMFSVTDRPVENKEAWATYRQELRDMTKQTGYPDDVIWPTPPDIASNSIEVTRV